MSSSAIPREAALLQALTRTLQQKWTPLFDVDELVARVAAVGVSAAPGTRWSPTTDASPVEMRALAIGSKLFAHFVSAETSIRVDFLCDEYITNASTATIDTRTQSRVGQWVVNDELLQWRLERNVYPLFGTTIEQQGNITTQAGAELARLPEPLLLRIAPYLSGVDYCKLTQANEFLHSYASKEEIWLQLLQHDYPHTSASQSTAKAKYITTHAAQRRQRQQQRPIHWTFPDDDLFSPPRILIPPGLRHPGLLPPPARGWWPTTTDPFDRDD